jgi:hypothetical protein
LVSERNGRNARMWLSGILPEILLERVKEGGERNKKSSMVIG